MKRINKKSILFVLALLLAFTITTVSALTVTSIMSQSAINYTFTEGGSNTTTYIEMSRFVRVNSATINVSGFNYSEGGAYTGESFITFANTNDMTNNGTFIWITRASNTVDKYWMNGTHTGDTWTASQEANAYGITTNSTYIWVSGALNITRYNMDGTYANQRTPIQSSPVAFLVTALTSNNTYIWAYDSIFANVTRNNMDGTYTNSYFIVPTQQRGNYLTQNSSHFWMGTTDRISRLTIAGAYNGVFFNTTTANNNAEGLTMNETFIWASDGTDNLVYKYWINLNPSPSSLAIDIENDGDNEFFMQELNSSNSPQVFNYTNLTNSLRYYINTTCSTDTCQIPLDISTDSAGIVMLDAISINYTPSRLYSNNYPSGNVLETTRNNFNATVLFDDGENPIVYLWYNGTYHISTQIEKNDNNATYRVLLDIPLVSDISNETRSFYWNITDSNSTWTTNNQNHNAFRMNLTNCTGLATTYSINFTLIDELTNSRVLGDLDSVWDFWAYGGDGTVYRNYSNGKNNNYNFSFCIYPEWANLTANFTLFYDATNYTARESFYSYYDLNNVSQNINLYLLGSGNATTFEVTVRDTDYIVYQGVTLVTMRYNPTTDSYIEVERSNTNEDGKVLTHLVLEDVYYQFMVLRGTEILHTTRNTRVYCPQTNVYNQCLMEVVIPLTPDRYPYIWDDNDGISFSVGWNNATNISSLTYSINTSIVDYVRFYNYQLNNDICDINQTAAAGVINCDLSGETGVINREVRVFRDGFEFTIWKDYLDLREPYEIFGTVGIFLTILFLIAIATAGLVTGNPMAVMIIFFVGLGAMVVTGIAGMSIGAYVLLSVIATLLVLKLRQ